MTAQDMRDLWAYLKTVPASAKPSRAHAIKFPYSWRAALVPWSWLYFDQGEFEPDPAQTPQVNRGAYLVAALTHCGECHTPRNTFGGLERSRWLTGARMPTGDLVAGNLTPDKSGLASWSADDIAETLSSGELPEGGTVGEEMSEVVKNSTSRMRPEDRAAIAAYLKSLPPLATTVVKKGK
jgi:mono/diheme cytochrome c family protein